MKKIKIKTRKNLMFSSSGLLFFVASFMIMFATISFNLSVSMLLYIVAAVFLYLSFNLKKNADILSFIITLADVMLKNKKINLEKDSGWRIHHVSPNLYVETKGEEIVTVKVMELIQKNSLKQPLISLSIKTKRNLNFLVSILSILMATATIIFGIWLFKFKLFQLLLLIAAGFLFCSFKLKKNANINSLLIYLAKIMLRNSDFDPYYNVVFMEHNLPFNMEIETQGKNISNVKIRELGFLGDEEAYY